jgi:hypothetical protein
MRALTPGLLLLGFIHHGRWRGMPVAIVKSAQRVFQAMDQPFCRPVDGLAYAWRMLGNRHGRQTFEPRFHHASLVVAAGFPRVLVAEMDFDPGDLRAEAAQCVLDGCTDGGCEGLATHEVVIAVDLDLHEPSLAFALATHNGDPTE